MKRILIKILIMLSLVGVVFITCLASGCSEDKIETINVSTFEELCNANKKNANKKVVLKNDIDGEGATVTGFNFSIDGNGHTISNLVVNGTKAIQLSLFNCYSVKNLTLDNIIINGDRVENVSIVCGKGTHMVLKEHFFKPNEESCGVEIENVKVKNSKIIATQYSAEEDMYVGGLVGNYRCSDSEKRAAAKIRNSSIENLTIEVKGKADSFRYGDVYVGGIAGIAANGMIENCSVKNSEISVESAGVFNDINTGFLAAVAGENLNIVSSYAEDNNLKVSVPYASDNIAHQYDTAETVIGGLIGVSNKNAATELCYSAKNKIELLCAGGYWIGGLIGSNYGNISQSYSYDLSVNVKGRIDGDKGQCARVFGGLCAYSESNSILSCFAYKCKIEDIGRPELQGKECIYGGLIGKGKSLLMQNCATYNILLYCEDGKTDALCTTKLNTDTFEKDSCYVEEGLNNNNECKIIINADWMTASKIQKLLNLSDVKWVLTDGAIPYLNL